jgi:hypothetical protein
MITSPMGLGLENECADEGRPALSSERAPTSTNTQPTDHRSKRKTQTQLSYVGDSRRPLRGVNTEAEEGTALEAIARQRLMKTQQTEKT